MIIIGSYAAKLGGYLPTWRDDKVNDIDLVCTEDEVDIIRNYLSNDIYVDCSDKLGYPNRYWFSTPKFNLDIHTHSTMLLLAELPDNTNTKLFNIDCLVVSKLTQFILKYSYSDYNIQTNKNNKDLLEYASAFDGSLPETHLKFAVEYRKLCKEKFDGT